MNKKDADKIKKYRMEKGYTIRELAEAVGITRQNLYMIEGGKANPSIKTCKSIAHVLGQSLDDLFDN